ASDVSAARSCASGNPGRVQRAGSPPPDLIGGGDERKNRDSLFASWMKAQMSRLPLTLTRPGERLRAGVSSGFADHAIAPRRFGEIKPPVGALEQPLIV